MLQYHYQKVDFWGETSLNSSNNINFRATEHLSSEHALFLTLFIKITITEIQDYRSSLIHNETKSSNHSLNAGLPSQGVG